MHFLTIEHSKPRFLFSKLFIRILRFSFQFIMIILLLQACSFLFLVNYPSDGNPFQVDHREKADLSIHATCGIIVVCILKGIQRNPSCRQLALLERLILVASLFNRMCMPFDVSLIDGLKASVKLILTWRDIATKEQIFFSTPPGKTLQSIIKTWRG